MNSIKLEKATKEELIQAIEQEFAMSDVRRRIERQVTHIRLDALLAKMKQACDDMDANRQKGPFDAPRDKRWQAAHVRWNRANNALKQIQGF